MIGALAAHGVDLGNGRSNVQHLSAEARRVRGHFSYARSKGLSLLSRFRFWFCFTLSSPADTEQKHVAQALANGIFAEEILPIELRGTVISEDDTVRPNVSAEGLAALKPSFPEWGGASTTAGNASGVGDGAALCILTTRARAEAEGYNVIAKFVGTAVVGVEPRHMGIAPIYAVPKVLAQTGLEKQDIDVYEVRGLSLFYVILFFED
jgi:Thiolase, N-terminal domain/Thiolase, C-terminal domain